MLLFFFLISLPPPLIVLHFFSLPNIVAKYVRVNASSEYLQISQLAVYDINGINVAKNRKTSAAKVHQWDYNKTCIHEYSADGPVDGILKPKDFTDCYSLSYYSSSSNGSYWQVDLGHEYVIHRIDYFNRLDCCQEQAIGLTISLLDEKYQIFWLKTLLSASLNQTLFPHPG